MARLFCTCSDRPLSAKRTHPPSPQDLHKIVGIGLDEQPTTQNLLEMVDNIFKYSIRSNHPCFFNQMGMGGTEVIGILGEAIAAAVNHAMYTYEMAPVTTLMERELIAQLLKLAGFESGDGMFNPGGSMSNAHAMLLARHQASSLTKTEGLHGYSKQLVAFTSAESHYCFERSGLLLGLGTENVIKVPVDDCGIMIPSELERLLEECVAAGKQPFFVNATAGSTVYGAVDPIRACHAAAKKVGAWFHVDGAWGSSALMSERHRGILDGVELADSISWNFHKLGGMPQSCSVLLCKDEQIMRDALKLGGDCSYLYHEQPYDVSIDSGEKSLQCGRRPDSIKLWLTWKMLGTQKMGERIDKQMANKESFIGMLRNRSDVFEMVCEPGFCNVCFWYKPKGSDLAKEQVHELTARIKQGMMLEGRCMVNYQPRGDRPNFFRMVFTNPEAEDQDLKLALDEIERIGDEVIKTLSC